MQSSRGRVYRGGRRSSDLLLSGLIVPRASQGRRTGRRFRPILALKNVGITPHSTAGCHPIFPTAIVLGIELQPAQLFVSRSEIAPFSYVGPGTEPAHLEAIQALELERLLIGQADQDVTSRSITDISTRCVAAQAGAPLSPSAVRPVRRAAPARNTARKQEQIIDSSSHSRRRREQSLRLKSSERSLREPPKQRSVQFNVTTHGYLPLLAVGPRIMLWLISTTARGAAASDQLVRQRSHRCAN